MRISKRNTVRMLGSAALGLLALCAPQAGAASLTVNGYTLGEQVNVIGSGRYGWVNTAELDVTLDGANGYSYCVDLAQNIGVGSSNYWSLREAEASAGIIRAAWLVEHFRPTFDVLIAPASDAAAWGATKETAIAALQVAVWEVLADAPGAYNLYSGGFRIASGGASAGVMNLARNFLAELESQSITGFTTDATWAYHAMRQDQIVVNPIPEPSSILLFVGGAGLVAIAAKRKRA
jgi:Thioester domain